MSFKHTKAKNKNSLFDNNSIKVIIIGSLAIVAALIVMGVTSIMIMNNAVVHKLKTNDLGVLAQSISTAIEGKLDKAVEASLIMANDPVMKNWVESGDLDRISGDQVKSKMKDMVEGLGYDTVFLVSNRTLNYWAYHGNTFELLDTVSEKDISDDWYFNFIGKKNKYEINIDYNKELKDTFVWINTLMGDTDNPIAVTGLGMNLSQVINELILDDRNSNIKNDIWLVDGSGKIYLSKNQAYMEQNIKDILPASLFETMYSPVNSENQFEIDEYSSSNHVKYDIAYKKINNTDWRLIVQIPRAESLKFLNNVTVNTVISCLLIIILMVITFYFISNRIANPYKRALQLNLELENIVASRTRELQEKNAKIQDSLDYAQMIQRTILPAESELEKYFKDHFVIFEPRETVGGDFYWMRGYREGVLLFLGDCTGHGVPGALMTTAVNAMLDHIADEFCHDNPAVILKELDRLIKQSFRKGSCEETISDGLDAAAFYISKDGKVLFAGANISLFLFDGENVNEIKGNKYTLDCIASKKEKYFTNHQIEYSQGNIFYAATDGYKDQPGGERKLPYGKRRLAALLKSIGKLDMVEQRSLILLAMEEYEAEETRRDDLTMIGFKL